MEDLKGKLLELVKNNINVPGLAADLLDRVLEPALLEAVQKSENKIDDIVVAALVPLLKSELKKAIKSEWDKLLVSEGEVL